MNALIEEGPDAVSTVKNSCREAGIEMEDVKDMDPSQGQETVEEPVESIDTLDSLSVEQLQKLLQLAIEEENYEKAAELRDLINSKM